MLKLIAALILSVGLALADRQVDFSTVPERLAPLWDRAFPRTPRPHENLGY